MSKGFGLNIAPEISAPNNLHRIIFDHLDGLFPAVNGFVLDGSGRNEKKNGFKNGAQGGTGKVYLLPRCNLISRFLGTDYFSYCFSEHVPEDVDLVLIELCKSRSH